MDDRSDLRNGDMSPDPDLTEGASSSEGPVDVEEISQEYDSLNTALDQVGSYMDALEEKNDSLYSRLQDLLADSREARIQIEEKGSSVEGRDKDSADTSQNR